MGPRVLEVSQDPPDPVLLDEVAGHLLAGGLLAMPTETVYGLGCLPEEGPLRRIQELKGRGAEKPFLVLIPGLEGAEGLEWSDQALELARVFWPGALTLVLKDPAGVFPPGVRSPSGGVAVRVSPHPLAQAVVRAVNRPVVSTSANEPGGSPALTAAEVLDASGRMGAGRDLWILDGGPLRPSDSSTIVDFTGGRPEIRRVGAVPVNRLRCVLPEIHDPS